MDRPDENPYFTGMPKINLEKSSNKPATEVFEQLKALFETDPELKKLDSSYVCNFDPSSLSGTAKGSKFSATMKVADQGGSSALDLVVEIPLMLSPFKGMIKETLEKKLDKALG